MEGISVSIPYLQNEENGQLKLSLTNIGEGEYSINFELEFEASDIISIDEKQLRKALEILDGLKGSQ